MFRVVFYDSEYIINNTVCYILMKKVRHGANEYHSGFLPGKRNVESVLMYRYLERLRYRITVTAGHSFTHLFGPAICATGTYFCASGDRVPGFGNVAG